MLIEAARRDDSGDAQEGAGYHISEEAEDDGHPRRRCGNICRNKLCSNVDAVANEGAEAQLTCPSSRFGTRLSLSFCESAHTDLANCEHRARGLRGRGGRCDMCVVSMVCANVYRDAVGVLPNVPPWRWRSGTSSSSSLCTNVHGIADVGMVMYTHGDVYRRFGTLFAHNLCRSGGPSWRIGEGDGDGRGASEDGGRSDWEEDCSGQEEYIGTEEWEYLSAIYLFTISLHRVCARDIPYYYWTYNGYRCRFRACGITCSWDVAPASRGGRGERQADHNGDDASDDCAHIINGHYITVIMIALPPARRRIPGDKAYLRIGEATNPGPGPGQNGLGMNEDSSAAATTANGLATVGAACFRDPARSEFRHAVLPAPEGRPAVADADMEHYSLIVDTANGTSWGPLARYLLCAKADLLLYQEHHLGPEELPAASALAQRLGWRSVFLPAEKGEGDGWRGGVAVLARGHIGLSPPRVGAYEVVPSRVLAVLVEAPGYRPFTALSAYLHHGQGLGDANMTIMEEMGLFIEAQGMHVPYLLGGDMQNDPADIARLGFAQRTHASLVASRDPRGTCRSSTATTELDYFFVHNALAAGIETVGTVEGAAMTPHVPVRLKFKPRLAATRTLVLRKPPPIGFERIHGPVPQPPPWEELAAQSAALATKVMCDDFDPDDAFHAEYSSLYERWADLAEREVHAATDNDVPVKKLGLRGRAPVLVWRSMQAEKRPDKSPQHVELDKWRNITMLINEVRGTLLWLFPAADDERWVTQQARERAGAPVPRSLDGPTTANVLAKLDSIRAQLNTELRQHEEGMARGQHPQQQQQHWTPQYEHEEETIDYAEMNSRLHALACAAEVAVASADATLAQDQTDGVDLPPRHARLVGLADRLQRMAQVQLKRAAADDRAAKREGWRSWVTENIASGARNAHRYLRIPVEWRPTTQLTIDGVVTADPALLLQGYATKYDALWNGPVPQRDDGGADGERAAAGGHGAPGRKSNARAKPIWETTRTSPLQRPTPAELRAAARTFRRDTAVAFDGLPMRAYDLLSDAALGIVADIFAIMEATGRLPMQLALVEMPMIEKAKGGHRAVATLVSLYRIWAKVRKPLLTEWELRNDRPYLAAGKGRSPQTSVWRQACHAEAAVEEGYHSATLLWDLSSFFEAVRREPLWHRAKRLGFPLPLLKVALCMYDSPRMLSLGGMLSAPIPADNGVLAGCGLAMALTRAYVIGPLDAVVENFGPQSALPARLDMYVDDLAVAAEGKMGQVVLRLANAAELLQEAIEGPLHCSIEVGKAAVVSSSKALTDILKNRFGRLAGAPDGVHPTPGNCPTRSRRVGPRQCQVRRKLVKKRADSAAPNLGIDYAAGQRRGTHGSGCRRNQRLARLRIKTCRLARIRSLAGRRAPLIFMAGPLPEATFGAAVNGLSDKEIMTIRRNAAQAYTPRARGRSLSKLMLLVGLPTWRAEVEVVLEYARQVWQASLLGPAIPADGTLTLTELSKIWHAVSTEAIITHDGTRRCWDAVRGPIGAMWLSLHRIGWTMRGPFTMLNHDKDEVMLTTTSPAMLAKMLHQAVVRALQLQVGEKLAATDDAFRGRRAAADHVAAQLRSDRRLTTKDKAAYMSVACGAVMTHSRAVACGYLVLDRCPLCGLPGDTIAHRVWRCKHHLAVQARESAAPRWLVQEFERDDDAERSTFWTAALIPHPADTWPAPAADATMCYEWMGEEPPQGDDRGANGDPLISGSLYVDGSCTVNVFPELRRAASSIIQQQPGQAGGWRLRMPVPRPLPQTPQSAEYATVVLARRYAHPTKASSLASDCANVVRDLNLPPMAALAGRKMYSGLLREVTTDSAWLQRTVIRKVPAHVNPTALRPGPERDDAVGNDVADRLAKEAVEEHPAPPPAMKQDLESALKRARLIVRTIAAVTQCFPPMAKERMRRPPPPVNGARVTIGAGHNWIFTSGMWRCQTCLRMTTRPQIDSALAHERCPGHRLSMDACAMVSRGHSLAQTDGALPVIFCVRCGAWSTRRAYGLSAPCRGAPAPSGRQALTRISRGYLPWDNRNVDAEVKRGKGIRCTSRWSTQERKFVNGTAGGRLRPERTARSGGVDGAPGHGAHAAHIAADPGALDEVGINDVGQSGAAADTTTGGPEAPNGDAEQCMPDTPTHCADMVTCTSASEGIGGHADAEDVQPTFDGGSGRAGETMTPQADAHRTAPGQRTDGGRTPIWMDPPSWLYLPHRYPPNVPTCGGGSVVRGDGATGNASDNDEVGAAAALVSDESSTKRRRRESAEPCAGEGVHRAAEAELDGQLDGKGRKRGAAEAQGVSTPTAAQRIEAVKRRVRARYAIDPQQDTHREDEAVAVPRQHSADIEHRGNAGHGGECSLDDAGGKDEGQTVRADAANHSGASACEGPGGTLVGGETGIAVDPFGDRAAVPVAKTSDAAALPQCTDEDARLARVSRGKAARSPPRGAAAPLEDSKVMVTGSLGRSSTTPQAIPQMRSGEGPQEGHVFGLHPLMMPTNKDLERGQATGRATLQVTGDPPYGRTERRRDGAGAAHVGDLAARGSGAAAETDIGMQPRRRGCRRHHHSGARNRECPPVTADALKEETREIRDAAFYRQREADSPDTALVVAEGLQLRPVSHGTAMESLRRRTLDAGSLDMCGRREMGGGHHRTPAEAAPASAASSSSGPVAAVEPCPHAVADSLKDKDRSAAVGYLSQADSRGADAAAAGAQQFHHASAATVSAAAATSEFEATAAAAAMPVVSMNAVMASATRVAAVGAAAEPREDALGTSRRRYLGVGSMDEGELRGAGGGQRAQGFHRLEPRHGGAGGQRLRESRRHRGSPDVSRGQLRQDSHREGGSHGAGEQGHHSRARGWVVRGSDGGPRDPLRHLRPRPDDARRRLCQRLLGSTGQSALERDNRGAAPCQYSSPSSHGGGGESPGDSAVHKCKLDEQAYHDQAVGDCERRMPPGDQAVRPFDSREHLLARLRGGPNKWPRAPADGEAAELGARRMQNLQKRPRLASVDEAATGTPPVNGGDSEECTDVQAAEGGATVSFAASGIKGRTSPGATCSSDPISGGDLAAASRDYPLRNAQGCTSAAAVHAAALFAWHSVSAGRAEPGNEGG